MRLAGTGGSLHQRHPGDDERLEQGGHHRVDNTRLGRIVEFLWGQITESFQMLNTSIENMTYHSRIYIICI